VIGRWFANRPLGFVLVISVVSLFSDLTHEGARSIHGPFLLSLGASALVVSTVAGFGALAGYGLRLFSGRLADSTGKFWPIIIFGYILQMGSVPALALAGSWPVAAVLIVLERVGKAIRNPARDTMLSHAGAKLGGYGWVFGLHEAFDQTGAMLGPLLVAGVLAWGGGYTLALAVLLVPALANLSMLMVARMIYPDPGEMQEAAPAEPETPLPRVFFIYVLGAALVAAGFVDYPLIAYHFVRTGELDAQKVAALYAVAMAVSGAGSLLLGRMFDRHGYVVLIWLTLITLPFAPLVFLGGTWGAVIGAVLWGIGMGGHESIIPAAVAPMVAVQRRATGFGLFTGIYGVAWFLGSVLIGLAYDWSVLAATALCLVLQIAALPPIIAVARRMPRAPKTQPPAG
jgi:MFS family permease